MVYSITIQSFTVQSSCSFIPHLGSVNDHRAQLLFGLMSSFLSEEVEEGPSRHELHYNVHLVLLCAHPYQTAWYTIKKKLFLLLA